MINLLPLRAKKELTTEYRIRVSIISLVAVFFIEILTLIFFVPSYYVLNLSTKKLTNDLEQRKLLSPGENKEILAELAVIKKEVSLLKPSVGAGSTTPSALLREILSSKPRGIGINAFRYDNIKNKINIQLSGKANTREDLIAFRKALTEKTGIADIKFGTSFITKKMDIEFTIMISFK